MDKNKTELEEFMGGLVDTKDPLDNKQEDPFASYEKEEEIIEKEDKPLPFNKDPKIQKYLDKREREIEERLASKFEDKAPIEKTQTTGEDDDFYARLIGNDSPEKLSMIKEYKAREEKLLNQAEERAFNRLTKAQQEELQADQEAEEELETAFDNIEENFGVDITSNAPIAKKTRQEFVSFVERIAPKDRNGDIVDYPDMQSAWETFSEMKKATGTPSRAKELASRSMQRSAETSSEPVLKRGRTPFSNSDDFIESLSK